MEPDEITVSDIIERGKEAFENIFSSKDEIEEMKGIIDEMIGAFKEVTDTQNNQIKMMTDTLSEERIERSRLESELTTLKFALAIVAAMSIANMVLYIF